MNINILRYSLFGIAGGQGIEINVSYNISKYKGVEPLTLFTLLT